MITTVCGFKASSGKFFDTQKEAEAEDLLDEIFHGIVEQHFTTYHNYSFPSTREIVAWILANYRLTKIDINE